MAQGTTFTKSVCEKYNIYIETPFPCWGIFTLDESDGLLSIVSDFGNFGYNWPRHGRPSFKHFLIELNQDYLMDKLFMGRPDKEVINWWKTKKVWRKKTLEDRRSGALTKETAADIWAEIENIDEAPTFDYANCSFISDFLYEGDYPHIEYEYHASMNNFFNILWKEFMSILKEEIEKGKS